MSSFAPQSFEEAKALYKPLSRSKMTCGSSKGLKASNSVRRKQNNRVKRKAKKLTDGQLKKRAWVQFSIFIRTEQADKDGFNQCVTCCVTKHWKELQAGHFIRGRLNANLFDERGTNPQCVRCNIHLQGNVVVYYKWMQAKYGEEVIDELIQQNSLTKKWKAGELLELLEKYKAINDGNPVVKCEP